MYYWSRRQTSDSPPSLMPRNLAPPNGCRCGTAIGPIRFSGHTEQRAETERPDHGRDAKHAERRAERYASRNPFGIYFARPHFALE